MRRAGGRDRRSVPLRSILPGLLLLACQPPAGHLELRILTDGEATPARIELLDAEGVSQVASDGLAVVLQCLAAPLPDWLQPTIESREIFNLYTGTTQFYAAGHTALDLPPGRYELRVFKGNEFRTARRTLEIDAGESLSVDVELERWIDPAARGFVSSDDHIHITRRRADQNPWLLAWMQAEGLGVANLLQMGTADQFDVTPQYAFGDAGVYGDGATRLFAGQEHPRTHFLGHTITLGAREPIDLREDYIVYDGFWRESERLGGVSGFAHYGQGPAQDGLALSAPTGGVHFIEVLQSEYLALRVWYELLDMGFRIAPSAGTDFPCISSLPGRERVYVGVDGPITRESFVAGYRAGRTFVTNGPVLELHADAVGIGGVIQLDAPGTIRVEGSVRYDPDRDHVRALELVQGGQVVRVGEPPETAGLITLEADLPIAHSTWLALRASGDKLDELPHVAERIPDWVQAAIDRFGGGWSMEGRYEFLEGLELRPSAAHTGAIYVDVAGAPLPTAPAPAREWLARLAELEARLGDARIQEIGVWDWIPYSDGVSVAHVRRHRPTLRAAIASARSHFETLAAGERP
jgi:hypothetical protein